MRQEIADLRQLVEQLQQLLTAVTNFAAVKQLLQIPTAVTSFAVTAAVATTRCYELNFVPSS